LFSLFLLLIFLLAVITLLLLHRFSFSQRKVKRILNDMREQLANNYRALSTERSRLAMVLSSMTEAVIAVDNSSRIIFANPAAEKLFNFLEPLVLGKTPRECLLNNEIADLIGQALKDRNRVEAEISTLLPIQGVFWAKAGPIKNEAGDILGIMCVLSDLTELKKLEAYRSEFVANVSHELKTPLTAIRNFVETLLAGAINDKDHNIQFLEKIDKHAVNLSALIDDILELTKLENKRELGPFAPVDIKEVLKRAVETIESKARKKGILIEKSCSGESFLVLGIEDHLYRALLNLLDNALNYSDTGGKIMISCQKIDGQIKISIADTGMGISSDHLPRLFERFYRIDSARSRQLGGTGLGLAIVKHVMNIHQGTVSVESELGKGSIFTLSFPAAIPTAS